MGEKCTVGERSFRFRSVTTDLWENNKRCTFCDRRACTITGDTMRQYVGAVWWFLFVIFSAACEHTPESARKELGQLGVAYSPQAFITSLTNNDLVTVQLFLKAGMDPNTTSAQGIPALLIATMNCDGKLREDKKTHADIAKALIAHGANVDCVRIRPNRKYNLAVASLPVLSMLLPRRSGEFVYELCGGAAVAQAI